MSFVILNADDFGLTEDTNRAIIELAAAGAISSTSLMVNLPGVDSAGKLFESAPNVGVGLHLNLTKGTPLTEARSLVDETGAFLPLKTLVERSRRGAVEQKQIEAEIGAQFERARSLAAHRLDHWDSHEGIHRYEPFASIAIRFGRQFDVRGMRIHSHFFVRAGSPMIAEAAGLRFGVKRLLYETYYYLLARRAERHFIVPDGLLAKAGGTTLDVLRLLIAHGAPDEARCWEIPCHPAASTANLTDSEQQIDRVMEYDLLRSTDWLNALRNGNIQLITFRELAALKAT